MQFLNLVTFCLQQRSGDFAGEEATYAGVKMSTLIENDNGIGDVISLLWFKRSLPRYCTKFIEVCF